MTFTETFKLTNQLCAFSPDGNFLANVLQSRLVVRDTVTTLDVVTYTCVDAISYIEWSPDSAFILCALHKKGLIQVWSIGDSTWTCKLNHGSLGLTASRWAPDSRHVLSTSDYKLRIIVWSLINKSASYIEHPKFSSKGLVFTKDRKYMAVGERRDCQDSICLFLCDGWEMLNRFDVETNDMAEVIFSPDGCMLAICDSKLEYKVVVYSLDGRLLFSYSAGDIALLGVKTIAWCPSNQYIFIGSYDQRVRVLNCTIWKPVCELKHVAKVSTPGVLVYEERSEKEDDSESDGQFLIHEDPVQLPFIRPDPEKPNPKLGVGTILCCHDSSFMATRNDNMPDVIWIWNLVKLKLDSVLVFKNNVKTFSWHPKLTQLAICTGADKFFIWCPQGCLTMDVPCFENGLLNLSWHGSGNALLLTSKNRMSICYLKDVESCDDLDDSGNDCDSLDGSGDQEDSADLEDCISE